MLNNVDARSLGGGCNEQLPDYQLPQLGFVPKRLALVTDAWKPQTNGVVNTLLRLVAYLESGRTNAPPEGLEDRK